MAGVDDRRVDWRHGGQRQERNAAPDDGPPKMRLRLPAYYARVVDEQQREQIYSILRACEEKLLPLREQINELELERDADVEKVLSEEQLAEVKRLTEEARQRRMERSAASSKAGNDEAKSDPDETAAKGRGRTKR